MRACRYQEQIDITTIRGSKCRIECFFVLWSRLNCNLSFIECQKREIPYYSFKSNEVKSLWNNLQDKDKESIRKLYNLKSKNSINELIIKNKCHIILDSMWSNDKQRTELYRKLKNDTKLKHNHFSTMNIYETHMAYKKLQQWKRENTFVINMV